MPKDYFTTVYHQKAVRVLGTRDLYLRTVYCHVVNYTQSQGKWSGTFQEMENQIEISKSKICRSMNQLIEMGLVRKEDKHTFIANSNPSVADSNQNDADSNKSVANSNSPCTPINKEETQVSDARMQAHDVPDSEVSFADFCAAYRRTCGPITMKQKDDAYEAWRKLNPRFKKALGHYNDSIYYNVNQQRYTENWIDFEESIVPLYTQIKKAFQGKISEHTIATEWCQTKLYYKVTQFWQMMRNDPNHDPFYDGKVFHYYDIDCY